MGVQRGDRVGIYPRKSIDANAALLGVMKAGAAYVPVDAGAQVWRAAYILDDCAVSAVVIDGRLEGAWREEAEEVGMVPALIALDTIGGGRGLTSALRLVLFAGEVLPLKHLREVQGILPAPRYFNLYGPTETNVCTYHPTPEVAEEDRRLPFSIGRVCEHLSGREVDADGCDVPSGEEGELVIAGGNVTGAFRSSWSSGIRRGTPPAARSRRWGCGRIARRRSSSGARRCPWTRR
jgi:acyl-CoA synthetase (AMP-forming)/AMP-acid ligase II